MKIDIRMYNLLVLPPELRPIVYRSGDKVVTSDINELYKRVIRRKNNLAYLLKRSELAPADLVMCQEKLVQEAVDTLLDSGSRGQPTRDGHNKVYKSLSDVIEGKVGRFRETAWETGRLLGAFSHCCGSFAFITSMWITSRDSNKAFSAICNSRFNHETCYF